MKKIVPKKYLARKFADYVGAFILAFLIVFIWQLYRSPIPLPFLKPYIIKALNHDDSDYIVTVDAVNLELVRSIQPIKIIANDVSYKKTDNSLVVSAPRTSISFSIRALLRGVISPSSIIVDKPSVSIYTSYGVEDDKSIDKKVMNEKKIGYYLDSFESFLEKFNSADMSYPESYIDEIRIKNAELEFHEVDLGRKWVFSDANYVFDRHHSYIELGLDALLDLDDVSVPFDLDLNFYKEKKNIEVAFSFSDLLPSNIMDNFMGDKEEGGFYRVNLPVSGKLDISIDYLEMLANKDKISKSLDTAIKKFDFQFEGGSGNIEFSNDKEFNYDISSFLLKGKIDSGLNDIKIENADFNLDDKKTTISLDISGVKNLIFENSLKDLKLSLMANIEKLNFDELSKYWPRYVAEDAWLWVKEGIYAGFVENASFKFDFAYDEKKKSVDFVNLSGVGYINDASLNYLEGMPHVHNVYGMADFYNDKINIKIDKGVSLGNIVHGGHVILYDLDKYDNFIDIELVATSSVSDSLKLIDNPPFNYAKEMGIDPDSIVGDAETKLTLNFELKKSLQAEEVKISVDSDLKNVQINGVVKDKLITSKSLKLMVDNSKLFVKGDVVLDEIAMDLEWTRLFKEPYQNEYRVSFMFNDEIKKKLGIDFELLSSSHWYGNANVVGDIKEINNKIVADIRVDLKDTKIDYDFLGFVKDRGEAGKANLKLNIVDGKVLSVENIMLAKEGFEANAAIELGSDESVKLVDIFSIKGPKIDAKGRIDFGSGKQPIKINISGNSYDISELFEKDNNIELDNQAISKKDDKDNLKDVADTDIYIAVDSLWTNKHVPVTNFAGNASLRKGIGIKEIRMIGNYSYKKDLNFNFEYLPHSAGGYSINVNSNDAGSTLKVLRIYDYMSGGNLQISALRDEDEKVIGHAKVRGFNIKNTNLLSRMLSLPSLTGILDMLRGDGVVFSHFDAPFTYKDKILNITDAKAFGNVLGITAGGYYNYGDGDLSIKGMIAPAYSINRFITQIPVVGTLLSGTGDTAFAASYKASGNIEDPIVKINTLSAISPNSIKELFSKDKSVEE